MRCAETLLVLLPIAFVCGTSRARAQNPSPSARLIVNAGQPGHAVSPVLFGIFFEEINHAGDGGLYAEMVRNRSFENAAEPEGWRLDSAPDSGATMAVVERTDAGPRNRRALELRIPGSEDAPAGALNDGYWGISVRAGRAYDLSLDARQIAGDAGPLIVRLIGPDNATLAQASTRPTSQQWQRLSVSLKPDASSPNARLYVGPARPGTVHLDMVSLFPRDTFKGRKNGLRRDLAQMLADLKPRFMRFPGGCWVEGDTMATAYNWKRTIGPVAERGTQWNLWGYHSTNGLGFHEYLQLAEDLGAEPLFVVNCGMSHREVIPMDQMASYVQDALDAIEYANGPATSAWGAERAKNGRARPFRLRYLQIGNENGGPDYNERYALFHDAIRARHPEIRLVANDWGGVPTSRPLDIVDEHYYSTPGFFLLNANRYDTYDREGPRIYIGEYAVTQGAGQGNLDAALGEAAFMTGIERNSDIVEMASYAPLFVNVNDRRWNPDLIPFDASRVVGTPSYYVQKLFSEHLGEKVLPLKLEAVGERANAPIAGSVGVGTWETQAEFKEILVTRGGETLYAWDAARGLDGVRVNGDSWSVRDGALRQAGGGQRRTAVFGDASWSDYALSLKARKLGGSEGFLILFHVVGERDWAWFNVGGWRNDRHAIEIGVGGASVELPGGRSGRVETDRWYDIRLEVAGRNVRAYLDDALVQEATLPATEPLYASATRGRDGGVILKVVNASGAPMETDVILDGAKAIRPGSVAWVLRGSPSDENTLDAPHRVIPRRETLSHAVPRFRHAFPGHSVTVMRLEAIF